MYFLKKVLDKRYALKIKYSHITAFNEYSLLRESNLRKARRIV